MPALTNITKSTWAETLGIGGEGFPGDLEAAGRQAGDHRRERRALDVQLRVEQLGHLAGELDDDAGLLAVGVEILERRIVERIGDDELAGLVTSGDFGISADMAPAAKAADANADNVHLAIDV